MQLTYSKNKPLPPKQALKQALKQANPNKEYSQRAVSFTPLAGKNQQTSKEQWVRGRRTGAGLMVFAVAGTKTPGRARGEDRENYAELLMSSAPCSLCSGRCAPCATSPLARPAVLVPATAKTINPAPVRLPLTDAIPHPRLRPIPPFAFYSILMYNNQVQNNKTDR